MFLWAMAKNPMEPRTEGQSPMDSIPQVLILILKVSDLDLHRETKTTTITVQPVLHIQRTTTIRHKGMTLVQVLARAEVATVMCCCNGDKRRELECQGLRSGLWLMNRHLLVKLDNPSTGFLGELITSSLHPPCHHRLHHHHHPNSPLVLASEVETWRKKILGFFHTGTHLFFVILWNICFLDICQVMNLFLKIMF